MKPVYCIDCTESQRKIWKLGKAEPGFRTLKTECLLAGAEDVPQGTKTLVEIEKKCKPWHYLFLPGVPMLTEVEHVVPDAHDADWLAGIWLRRAPPIMADDAAGPADGSGWDAPTVDDLNEDTDRQFDPTAVALTTGEGRARLEPDSANGRDMARRDEERLRDLRLSRMPVMDGWRGLEPDERR